MKTENNLISPRGITPRENDEHVLAMSFIGIASFKH